MVLKSNELPNLGFGLGLRTEHYNTIINDKPDVDWFEIISENFMVPGGKPLYYLDQICEQYPMVMHGVSMSIGSTDPLDWDYLKELKKLARRVKPKWISDHLCWTGISNKNMHDLLPIPYTQEALDHIVTRLTLVQDFLETRLLLENPSTYLTFKESEFTEWDFLNTIVEQSDSLILLDVNNVYVCANNHGFNSLDYINNINHERVQQIHLAGHSKQGEYIIDTHDAPIIDPVYELYSEAIKIMGLKSTMIERDDNIPELQVLLDELEQVKNIAYKASNKTKQKQVA